MNSNEINKPMSFGVLGTVKIANAHLKTSLIQAAVWIPTNFSNIHLATTKETFVLRL